MNFSIILAHGILPYPIRFWILLVFDILSISCSIFLLYLILTDRKLRQALNNHIVIVLLIINLVSQSIDNSLYLNYLRIGSVWPASPIVCLIWILVNYQFYVTSTLLVAFASIQRHILIFHRQWFSTRKRRRLLHHLPMIILLVYCITYSCVLVSLILTNGYTFDYNSALCGELEKWIENYSALSIWNLIVNEILSAPIIIIFSIILFVKVIRQKHRIGQIVTWRKQRKMTIQLLSISVLFCLINLPPILLHVARLIPDEKHLLGQRELQIYFSYFMYYQSIFLPFVCLISLFNNAKKLTSKIWTRWTTR